MTIHQIGTLMTVERDTASLGTVTSLSRNHRDGISTRGLTRGPPLRHAAKARRPGQPSSTNVPGPLERTRSRKPMSLSLPTHLPDGVSAGHWPIGNSAVLASRNLPCSSRRFQGPPAGVSWNDGVERRGWARRVPQFGPATVGSNLTHATGFISSQASTVAPPPRTL